MGKFHYDGMVEVDFDDRLLLHLETVIGAKLRQGEAFHFTWRTDAGGGQQATTVWMHPRASLVYEFIDRTARLNRSWVEALAFSANSPGGLRIVPEPPEEPEDWDASTLAGGTTL